MKKMRIFTLILSLMLCFVSTASANGITQVDNAIAVSGTASANTDVLLKITDISGELAWIDSTEADENGAYSFEAKLPVKDTTESYAVFLGGVKNADVTVLSNAEVEALFSAATAENAEELILTYQDRLGLDLSSGYEEAERDEVNSIFLKSAHATSTEIAESFVRGVVINKINNADRSTLPSLLKDNSAALGIDYENDIESLSAAKQEAFIIEMLKEEYSDYDEFIEGIEAALKTAEDTEEPSEDKDPPKKSGSSGGGGGKVSVALPGASQAPVVSDSENNESTQTDEIFSDIESVLWAKEHIESLYEKGVVSGRGDGKFAPNDAVKREEFVAMIVRMFELSAETDSDFDDISAEAWYKEAIGAAVGCGIINGVSEDSFGVGTDITRQDCATICARILAYFGLEAEISEEGFADNDEISEYAKDAVYIMKALGIINGMDDNNFNPQATCTRAMAAKIIDMLGGCIK